jgi:hypothetical protein
MMREFHELREWLEHKEKELKAWLLHHFPGQKPRSWRITIWPLEPITKEKPKPMDPLDLGQIPLGQRRPVDFVPDEAVDVKSDGNFASVTVDSGDATAQIAPGSTALKFRAYFNGDGAVGKKSALVAVDGHVGDGDVEITQEVLWEVTSPDATAFTATPGPLEPIPVTPPPAAARK